MQTRARNENAPGAGCNRPGGNVRPHQRKNMFSIDQPSDNLPLTVTLTLSTLLIVADRIAEVAR